MPTSPAPKNTPVDRQTRSDTVSSRAGNSAEAATQDIVKIIVFARKLWILDMDTATTGVTTGVAGDVSIGPPSVFFDQKDGKKRLLGRRSEGSSVAALNGLDG